MGTVLLVVSLGELLKGSDSDERDWTSIGSFVVSIVLLVSWFVVVNML